MRLLLISAAVSFACLGALALLVRAGLTAQLDLTAMIAAQSIAGPALDAIANVHTLVGHAAVTVPIAAAAAYATWRRRRDAGALAPLLIVLTAVIELALKLTTGQAPPGEGYDRSFVDVPSVATPSSFPSGHAARIAFLSVYVAGALAHRAWDVAAGIAIVLTLFLRVYIGDHWPSDVLGGALLGAGCAWLALAWRYYVAKAK